MDGLISNEYLSQTISVVNKIILYYRTIDVWIECIERDCQKNQTARKGYTKIVYWQKNSEISKTSQPFVPVSLHVVTQNAKLSSLHVPFSEYQI